VPSPPLRLKIWDVNARCHRQGKFSNWGGGRGVNAGLKFFYCEDQTYYVFVFLYRFQSACCFTFFWLLFQYRFRRTVLRRYSAIPEATVIAT
jgi:hypothetical protein